ncbi:MAG: PKD domain-containing protein [Myxococcales bacterium]|nr:PKD domain-containing protein [Myxococcales bacterium]
MTNHLVSAATAAALALCACSGSANPTCNGLEAIAGPAQTVAKHATVTLSGSATKNSGGVTYSWRLDAPAGSNAALSSQSAAAPTFVPDVGGQYFATLFVRDSCGTSAPSTTVITVANHPPVASAGPERHAMPGDTVTLDGTGSSDSDQDTLRYQWSIVSRPPGSNAVLSSATAASPTFTPDAYGTYTVILVVSDGEDVSDPAEVVVKVGVTGPNGTCAPAAPPVASAGPDQTSSGGFFSVTAQLDGSASTIGRPGSLTFKWTLTSKPSGSNAQINDAHAIGPVLQSIDRPGTYVATLVVNDGCVDSGPSTVRITRPNSPPSTPFISTPFQPVVLLPFGMQAISFDNDGDPLTCEWQLVSRPAASAAVLAATTSCFTTFTPDVEGTYTFSAIAKDPVSSSSPGQGSVTVVNLPPVARVGLDQAVTPGTSVTLDGSTSSDPSQQALTYAWTLQRPAGSSAALSDPAAARPTFTVDVAGVYRAQLIVSVPRGLSSQPVSTTVAGWPAVTRLAHHVSDAVYSKPNNLIVMVASDQKALFLFDPHGTEASVPLPDFANSVGLDPSGDFAAVGHPGGISLVDLVGKSVLQTVSVLGGIQPGASVALDTARDFAFAFQTGVAGDHARLVAAPFATGTPSLAISGQVGTGRARFRPADETLYLTANGQFGFGGTIEEYVLAAGALKQLTLAPTATFSTCGDVWLSDAADVLFTRCGSVFRASSGTDDLSALGTLARPPNASLTLRHLSTSATGEISAIANADGTFFGADDQTLRRWAANDFSARESIRFPAGTSASRWQGRFVFYRSDGSERYVLLQLVDQTTSVGSDYGFVIF